jgi:hypothetical protein
VLRRLLHKDGGFNVIGANGFEKLKARRQAATFSL